MLYTGLMENQKAARRLLLYIRVDAGTGCWNWTGGKYGGGYGMFWFEGRHQPAHRVAYRLFVGPFCETLQLNHQCDNRACVNPLHVRIGTQSQNMREAHRRVRKTSRIGPEKALEIRERYAGGGVSQKGLAREYGVRQCFISEVLRGLEYEDVKGPIIPVDTRFRKNKLTPAQRADIKARRAAGESGVALAEEFGVTPAAISYVWRHT
jgi:hypothetical protein